MAYYLIKSEKGFWMPGGFGYTDKETEAGNFHDDELPFLNLDGCELIATELKPKKPSRLGDYIAKLDKGLAI